MLFNDYGKKQLKSALYSIIMQFKPKDLSLLLSQRKCGQCLQAEKAASAYLAPALNIRSCGGQLKRGLPPEGSRRKRKGK